MMLASKSLGLIPYQQTPTVYRRAMFGSAFVLAVRESRVPLVDDLGLPVSGTTQLRYVESAQDAA